MNREIKFRVFDKKNGIYYYSELITISPTRIRIVNRDLDSDDCIVQQFTGLKDKNGREIYEGDILKYSNGLNYLIHQIEFFDGCFGLYNYPLFNCSTKMLEILGNIFENPELLSA